MRESDLAGRPRERVIVFLTIGIRSLADYEFGACGSKNLTKEMNLILLTIRMIADYFGVKKKTIKGKVPLPLVEGGESYALSVHGRC